MIIKTFNGIKAVKTDCRKIKGDYYEMNTQCFLMPDGKWHRINNGKITKDYESDEYVFTSDNLEKGIVGRNIDGTMKLGFFTRNASRNVVINDGRQLLRCIDRNAIKGTDALECKGDGQFYLIDKDLDFLNRKTIRKGYDNLKLEYRCDSRMDITTKSFNKFFKGGEFKHSFHKELPPVTFGVEFETENGRIPQDLLMQNGLIPVRDGSLKNNEGTRPYEYATIILEGKTGLKAISKQCDLLNNYCVQSSMNSLHIHIGGIPITKEYVVSSYIVMKEIQEEMYSMFPESMNNTASFKGQDYCNPLKGFRFKKDDVSFNFNKIYKHLAMNEKAEFGKFKDEHPSDPGGTSKWNVKTRYKICNFITTIFGKNATVEFRIHTSTFNKDKVANWLYLVSAICWYSYNHKGEDQFKGLTIENIINEVYNSSIIKDYLNDYVQYRKETMLKHKELGDTMGKLDVKDDNLINFKSKVKSLIEHE